MSFLTPLFLIGLAGLAIPVVIHLIQKERKNVVQFPSLMFLRRIPYESVQRRRIRHWLLLMMRLAALALLVLAFARPFVRRTDAAAAGATGAREVVILIDRSYSMGYGDRWQRALSAARDTVNKLGASDRGSVVFFSAGADVAVRSTADKGRLLAALTGVEPSAGATHFGPALKLAGSILSESALPRKDTVMVSDFQRAGWQGAEGLRLPDGATLTPVDLGGTDTVNAAVTPVALERSMFSNQERVSVTAGILNHGGKVLDGVDVALEVDGRSIQTKQVRVEANGSASTTFDPLTIATPNMRASIRIGRDALERDNVFHFVLSPARPIRVLLAQRSGVRDTNLYLARALSVGDAPRFDLATRDPDAISADDLQSAGIVILNDVTVTASTADRLGRFVQRGGGLLFVAGQRGVWPQEHAAILPATVSEGVDRTRGQPARLVALEYGHAIFDPFRAPRSGDFSAARFYGYRAATKAPDGAVLARFDDGAPALLEKKMGSGRVLVWLSSLDLVWNDLAVKPVFLPFVHQMARHLGAYRETAPWLTVGDVLDPAAADPTAKPSSDRAIVSPSGQRLALDSEGPDVMELAEQGFYEIRGLAAGAVPTAIVASNVDLRESDPTAIPATDVVAAATGRAGGTASAQAELVPSDAAQEAAQRVWWYLLFAGLILLSGETLLSNRVRM
jgi:hypothetical protein